MSGLQQRRRSNRAGRSPRAPPEHRVHPRRRSRLGRSRRLRLASPLDARAGSPGRRRCPVPSRVRGVADMLTNPHRALHGPLPGPARRRLGGAADQPRLPARHPRRSSDAAVATARRRLPHGDVRQVALRLAAVVQSAADRLRRVLREFRWRARLLQPHRQQRCNRISTRGRSPVEQIGYYTEILSERAAEFSRRQDRQQSFYLQLNYTAPHWPWEGPHDQETSARVTRAAGSDALRALFHLEGGSLEHLPADGASTRQRGRHGPRCARWQRPSRRHDRRVRIGQRRRAVRVPVAVRRREGRSRGGRHPRAVHRSLARSARRRPGQRPAGDHDGLDGDAAGRRRSRPRPCVPAGRDSSAAVASRRRARASIATCSGELARRAPCDAARTSC